MLLYTKRAPPREPKKRSRAGCVQCKEKKKKCDEAHPVCSRCAERGLACEYEPIKPRRRRADARPLDEDEAFSPSGFTGPSNLAGPSSAAGEGYGVGSQMRSDSFDSYVTTGSMSSMQPGSFSGPYAFSSQNNNPFLGLQGNDYLWESSASFIPEPIGSYPETAPSENSPPSLFSSRHQSITGRPGLSPATTGSASLSPLDQSQPQTSFSRQQDSPFFNPGGIPILRSQSTTGHKPQSFSELPPPQKSLSISSGPSRQEERILPPLSNEFSDLTPRLFEHLRDVMARLTVVHEHNGSVLKKTLSDKSVITPLVMHASCALACAHLANFGHIEESKALQWHTSIVQALLQNFQRGDTKDTETLARVAMLLLQYEIVKGGSLDVMRQHASAILAMLNDRANHQADVLNLYSRRFFWFDLFLSLSCRNRPTNDYSLFTSTLVYINPPFETFYNTIDQIHGLAIEIIPFLYEIAHLADLRVQAQLRPDAKHSLHIRAAGIEDRLRQWRIPQVSREFLALTSPSDTEVEGILLHGEAFRWAALLYLYVDILDTPRTSPHVTSTTTKVLDLVSRLLGLGGPVVGIIWPLFTAASEAHLRSDQDVARSCFERLMNVQRFKNVETARYACEELWRRWEAGEPNLGWRDVQRDIGRDIILC